MKGDSPRKASPSLSAGGPLIPWLERDGLVASTARDGHIELEDRTEGKFMLISSDDARWLITTALPALLDALSGPEPVPDAIRQGYREVREQ